MGNPTLILFFSSSFSNAASISLVSLAYMSCSEISGTDITERLVMETGKEKNKFTMEIGTNQIGTTDRRSDPAKEARNLPCAANNSQPMRASCAYQ
ncbi:hypothetical protein BJ166DRAFT_506233 [Pestalotiopsis sp. NC0098]|nr:hypothetical protein BJ166DRAFT_506233 [Pestalotiopsis sp. NC0098]